MSVVVGVPRLQWGHGEQAGQPSRRNLTGSQARDVREGGSSDQSHERSGARRKVWGLLEDMCAVYGQDESDVPGPGQKALRKLFKEDFGGLPDPAGTTGARLSGF